jgi:NADH dehydrogenase
VLLAEAVGVDVASRKVKLRNGELSYDYLILTPGVRHAYLGHNDWEPWAPARKTPENALEMRRRILLALEKAECESDEAWRRAADHGEINSQPASQN